MTETETEEHERKVREYWAKTSAKKFSIYNDLSNLDFKNENDIGLPLPFEPTAILATKAPPPTNQPPARKRFSIYDLT